MILVSHIKVQKEMMEPSKNFPNTLSYQTGVSEELSRQMWLESLEGLQLLKKYDVSLWRQIFLSKY